MRTLKLTLEYDGTDFVGWQRQAEGVSIQGLLEDALAPFEGRPVTVHGAGRTDAGVHALGAGGQRRRSTPRTSRRRCSAALNAVLPGRRARRCGVEEAAPDFHARFSATGKVYEYRIVNAPFVSPFLRRYAWHVPQPLDLEAMRTRRGALVGTPRLRRLSEAPAARCSIDGADHRSNRVAGRRGRRRSPRDACNRRRIPPPHGAQHRRHAVEVGGRDGRPSEIGEVLAVRDSRGGGRTRRRPGLVPGARSLLADLLYTYKVRRLPP